MSEQTGQTNDEPTEQETAQSEEDAQGHLLPAMFFPKIQEAVKAVTPDIDWKKAFEGVSVYHPQ